MEVGETYAGAGEAGVTWRRFMALAVWTFTFLLVGWMAFGFLTMGDCHPGPEGAECREFKSAQPLHIAISEAAIYAGLTWAFFIRRWRKS